ncbi:MAG TPA: FeoB-associated Cys-rich membrane protein [Candidatus Brocadiia bacterium]|nr:FeoB-associated Cys-rich membrane protein [Candidatus Brocadiia bacterium]
MTETLTVAVLVAAAAAWVGWTVWKRLSGREGGCRCDGCDRVMKDGGCGARSSDDKR